jgi:hypothetical protein
VTAALMQPSYAAQLDELIKARCAKRGQSKLAWTYEEQANQNPLTLTP